MTSMWPYYPELLEQPVPRYTSYPTAAEFHDGIGEKAQARALDAARGDLSLYVHIPYCEKICWYCGCNTGAANRGHRLSAYLDALDEEISLVAPMLNEAGPIRRIAFGGGSPNAISPIAFIRLFDRLITAFPLDNARLSIEIDPRGFGNDWARALGAVGATHVSMGVQTFSPDIQAAIGRIQPVGEIARALDALRQRGVESVNFDLMYGLPRQGWAELEDTLERTLAMRPERIALFGYAHVPHLLPRQKRIDASILADQAQRFEMAARGHDYLTAAGYVPVGFDHFALPQDSMAIAAQNGQLRRNFQGFTDDQSEQLIGLGASSISIFPDAIIQNEKNAGRYRMRMSQGQLAGVGGVLRTAEDRARGMIIEDILCHRPTDIHLDGKERLIMGQLQPFIDRDLISLRGTALIPRDSLRPYARSLAALFDNYRNHVLNRFSNAV